MFGGTTSLTFHRSHSASACSLASAVLMSSFVTLFLIITISSCWFVARANCNLHNETKRIVVCELTSKSVIYEKPLLILITTTVSFSYRREQLCSWPRSRALISTLDLRLVRTWKRLLHPVLIITYGKVLVVWCVQTTSSPFLINFHQHNTGRNRAKKFVATTVTSEFISTPFFSFSLSCLPTLRYGSINILLTSSALVQVDWFVITQYSCFIFRTRTDDNPQHGAYTE